MKQSKNSSSVLARENHNMVYRFAASVLDSALFQTEDCFECPSPSTKAA